MRRPGASPARNVCSRGSRRTFFRAAARGARPDHRLYGPADHRRRARRPQLSFLGSDRLPFDQHHCRSVLWKVRRYPWPQNRAAGGRFPNSLARISREFGLASAAPGTHPLVRQSRGSPERACGSPSRRQTLKCRSLNSLALLNSAGAYRGLRPRFRSPPAPVHPRSQARARQSRTM